jgi:5-methylcytosine-specific restriction endonuclease McrA
VRRPAQSLLLLRPGVREEGHPTAATIEHKKARMDGGTNARANLAAACFHCNQHRGAQMNRARQLKAACRSA